jgi:hypothetical protein
MTVNDFRVDKGAAQQKYENLSHITKLTDCIGLIGFDWRCKGSAACDGRNYWHLSQSFIIAAMPCKIDFWQSVGIGLVFLLKCRFSVWNGFDFGIEKSLNYFVFSPVFFFFFLLLLVLSFYRYGHVTVTVMLPLRKDQFLVCLDSYEHVLTLI